MALGHSAVIDCPICSFEGAKWTINGDTSSYLCRRCGEFLLTGTMAQEIANKELDSRTIANASAWIRENQGVRLTSYDLDGLLNQRTPTVAERAMKALRELARRYPGIGEQFSLDFSELATTDPSWIAVTWSQSIKEVEYLFVHYLQEEMTAISGEPIRGVSIAAQIVHEQITPHGHQVLDEMRHGNPDSAMGFCAMWFDDSLKPLWTEAIEPAIGLAGYDPKRIDEHEHVNKIDDEIIAMIRRSKFVVADFTGQRGGVYFEAGFALALGLPVIWLCREDQLKDVHFDTRQYNFLRWKPGEYDELTKRLQTRIVAQLGQGPTKRKV